MSDRTVKKHLENIYDKFGVQSRLGAVMYALQKLGVVNQFHYEIPEKKITPTSYSGTIWCGKAYGTLAPIFIIIVNSR
ncbi:LuxR C-terminal-related transcriptional regulator [Anabaena azotica]|uniref:LuxR C-terminal-related transcriptional regulator n=1 Tax=Anabaena azotica TaxID=197653 RepID=UPI0039A75646